MVTLAAGTGSSAGPAVRSGSPDDAVAPENPADDVGSQLEVLPGVGGGDGHPEAGRVLSQGGVLAGVDEDALAEQLLADIEDARVVADHDRDHLRRGAADVDAV